MTRDSPEQALGRPAEVVPPGQFAVSLLLLLPFTISFTLRLRRILSLSASLLNLSLQVNQSLRLNKSSVRCSSSSKFES